METLVSRKSSAPAGSYTKRLFEDPVLLKAKIMEEAQELCDADSHNDIAFEAADLIFFALAKCVGAGVSLEDIGNQLDRKSKKVFRRPGDAKHPLISKDIPQKAVAAIKMKHYDFKNTSAKELKLLLQRPIINSEDIIARVTPIMKQVREQGDKAIVHFTQKFDGVELDSCVLKPPFHKSLMNIDHNVQLAIDQAFSNIKKFHQAQFDPKVLEVETFPGVFCSRFTRPIEKVGLYVPGGTAVLPSTALMLGIPAQVAGCKEIVLATPPRKDGKPAPEVMYVAEKIGATCVLLAGGAQAVAGMAYGTESVPKVDKIVGPGNQYVTAAKMIAQVTPKTF
jgi:phosphoribosyl-ATP pyrophosphohydrolase/phosphoribosyl-AMP cyclohydrolase/histidinol dehydrogenase